MKRYTAEIAPDDFRGFMADEVEIRDGCIIATINGSLSIAYGQGAWLTVFEDDA